MYTLESSRTRTVIGLLRAARIAPPAVLWQTLPPDLYRSLRPMDGSVARNLSESKFMQALNDYGTLCALVEDHGGTIFAPRSGICIPGTGGQSEKYRAAP